MFKFAIYLAFITYVSAGNLLNGAGLSGGFAGTLGLSRSAGYGGPALSLNRGYSAHSGPVTAAIQSRRTYELRPVALTQEPAVPQVIEVEASEQPVQLIFRSLSSPVFIQQVHTPGEAGQLESTKSEEEPHKLVHEVYKPVIQEVREVIQPLRRVVQEVKPVIEEVHTVVAKGEPRVKALISPIPVATPVVTSVQQTIVQEEQTILETPLNEKPVLTQSDEGFGYKSKARKA